MKRLLWLDVAKGLAILWVVYFYFYRTYFEHGELPPADWSNLAAGATTVFGHVWLQISGLGFHAVGVFIILSGWALMESTARRAESGRLAWGVWYRSRFLRLYPMYRVAHLVYLVSPFVVRPEQVDGRIVLSLLGFRFVNIEMNYYYLNPAWWYFAMLIQFYLLFPLLFRAARKLGPCKFLLAACAVGFLVRYLMLVVYPQNGMWIQGGFAICRLPEFALGMTLGMWHTQSTARAERFFLGGAGLVAGLLLYPAALQLYHNGYAYIFVDFATGACCFLESHWRGRNHFSIRGARQSVRPRWGVFLRHFPGASTLRHLAWTAHPGATDLDVSAHRRRGPGCAQRVGNCFGKKRPTPLSTSSSRRKKRVELGVGRSCSIHRRKGGRIFTTGRRPAHTQCEIRLGS